MPSAARTFVPLVALAVAACDSATSAGAGGDVRLRMGARTAVGAAAPESPLVLPGDNGELTITDLRVIVAEFELKGDDDLNPCDRTGAGEDCEDFDAGPLFVDLPLHSSATVSTGTVPPGTYRELEFEVEDLDDDEEDPAEAARIQALLQQVRAQFPDWPRDASMLVVGSFRPREGAGLGAPRPFRVYIEAEMETEVVFSPPLVVGSAPLEVTVTLDPALVFRTGTQVVDLARFDGQLLEWEMDDGFRVDHSGPN
jgi:hypothetical protein